MKRQRKVNGNREPRPVPTPLKGALVVDDAPGGVALNLIARFEEMERQQKYLMEANQLLTFQMEQIQADRDQALADLEMAREQMIEVMKKKPTDPKVLREMWLLEQEAARKRHAEARARFKAELETMPKGTIISNHSESITVGVNSIYYLVQPGENKDVPAAFIEEWENRVYAEEAARDLRNRLSFNTQGGSKGIKDANDFQRALGKRPIWNEHVGSLVSQSAAEQFA